VDLVIFNQILLSLFDISNTFQYSILLCLYRLPHVRFNVSRKTRLNRQINLKKYGLKN